MKVFLMTVLAALAPFVACYDEKYDKMDIDKILGDEKILNSYINCYLDKGPCDEEYAAEFKELLPEVIATNCGKCSPIQKSNIKKTVISVTTRKPEILTELLAKYDPDNTYQKSFTSFILSDK